MRKLAVFGNPIAHSLSPQIHKQFAAQFQLDISYEKILVPLDGFREAIENFFYCHPERSEGSYLGCNVTVPFKVEAFKLVDVLSGRAQAAGAVNTIKLQDGKLYGDNTDGIGFLNDLRTKGIALKNLQVVIVGAGGAAQGLLPLIMQVQPKHIVIVNRNLEKAQAFSRHCEEQSGAAIQVLPLEHLPQVLNQPSLLIDTTSNFDVVKAVLAQQNLRSDLCIYDLKYGREAPTPLVQWAKQQGLQAYDGLGMLIEQAAEAFYIWFGVRPDTKSIVGRISA